MLRSGVGTLCGLGRGREGAVDRCYLGRWDFWGTRYLIVTIKISLRRVPPSSTVTSRYYFVRKGVTSTLLEQSRLPTHLASVIAQATRHGPKDSLLPQAIHHQPQSWGSQRTRCHRAERG